jgi:hypothetical protein
MYHHDDRDYDVAASAAAAKGRQKMEEIIHRGQASAESVVEIIQSRVIKDRVARAPAVKLAFNDEGERRLWVFGDDVESLPLHDHGMGQLLQNVGLRKDFADHLKNEAGGSLWGKELLAHNVNEILAHRTNQRNLIRAEGGDELVKGFLSDSFRRLDSRPLTDAFLGACTDYGLLPIEGVASETKLRLRAVMPRVFEPIDNEVMIFGVEFGNSDYGDGGVVVNLWTMRVWCTNLAVAEKGLRQVHLGSKLPDNISFSDRTYRLDAETTAAAIGDVTGQLVGPSRINRMLTAIQNAGEKEVKGRDGIDKALARVLRDNEKEQVKAIYEGPDVVNLPPGETYWRLSNAVSWFAQSRDLDPNRKLDLQQFAGQLVAGDKEAFTAV